MRNRAPLLLALMLAITPVAVAVPDTVVLKDGTIIECEVISDTPQEVLIRGTMFGIYSEQHRLPRSRVASVRRVEGDQSQAGAPKKPETPAPPKDAPTPPAPNSKPMTPAGGTATDPDESSSTPPPSSRKVKIGGGVGREASEADDAAPAAEDLVEAIVTGVGKTQEEAEKRALRSAVEQVVGTLVLAKDIVENDAMIESKVIAVANGFVERYEAVGTPKAEDGLLTVKIRAWVRVAEVATVLSDNAIAVRGIDGKSLAAKVATKQMRDEEAIAAIQQLFEHWPNEVLDVGVISPTGDKENPVQIISKDDAGGVVIEVWVQAMINNDRWAAWARRAEDIFGRCALTKAQGWWSFRNDWKALNSVLLGTGSPNTRRGPKSDGILELTRSMPRLARIVPLAAWDDSFIIDQYFPPAPYEEKHRSEAAESPGGVMLFPKIKERAEWYKLSFPLLETVERSSSRVPTVDVRISSESGERLGQQLTDWKEQFTIDAIESVEVWNGGPLGREQLFGSCSLGNWSFSAAPLVKFGTTISFFPRLLSRPISGYMFRNGVAIDGTFGSRLASTSITFPYRFYLSAAELASVRQVSVEMTPPSSPPSVR